MKCCTSCKIEKPLTEFSPSKRGLFGVQAKCKPCYAKIMRDRRTADPTKHRASVKKARETHYEKVLERNRLYRLNNPEKVSEWKRKDRIVNKVRVLADNAKRRSLTKGPVSKDVRMIYALRDFYAAMSLGEVFHVDHIIPVSKKGLHEAPNLRVIPAIDNLRKGAEVFR